MIPLVLSVVSALLVTAGWLHYLAAIPREKVPVDPRGHLMVMYGGMALGIAGAAMSMGSPLAVALGGMSVGLGAFFRYLLAQAPVPDGRLVVSVGDALPAFTALDEHGHPFASERLAGKRLLFKFFRGSW